MSRDLTRNLRFCGRTMGHSSTRTCRGTSRRLDVGSSPLESWPKSSKPFQ